MAAKGGGELLSPIRSKLTRTVTPSNRDVVGVTELNTTEYWLDCTTEWWGEELVAGWALAPLTSGKSRQARGRLCAVPHARTAAGHLHD